MEQNHLKEYAKLRKVALQIFFALLFVDFIFYKIFGETYTVQNSTGRGIFVTTTVLCGVSFVFFLIALICELISSGKKKPRKFPMKLLIWGIILIAFNFAHQIFFGRDIILYPDWAKITLTIGALTTLVITILFTALLIIYLVALAEVEKKE